MAASAEIPGNPFRMCSNCEGEGWVVIWGDMGHELPASRLRDDPNDAPPFAYRAAGKPYPCPHCQGYGEYRYALLDRRVPRPGAVPMQLGDPPKRRRNSLLVLVFPAVSDDPLDLTA